ncbi:MAG: hypothetical protein KAG18_02990, partial [Sinobacterium sp.]|nr:hypothetical protein [Sinobacterium sp.]
MSDKQAQLAEKLKQLSPEQRQALLAKLQAKKAASNIQQSIKDKPIERVVRAPDSEYPLSFSQQRLWFLTQLEGASSAYNIAGGLELTGQLNVAILEKAIQQLIAGNEILRTIFVERLDGAKQKILPQIDWALEIATVEASEINTELSLAANTLFDLSSSPLFAIRLLKVSDSQHVLSLVFHHIISDGWSNQIMLSELSKNYAALQSNDTTAQTKAIEYVDFSAYHHKVVDELGDKQLEFWSKALENNEPLNLTADFNRTAESSSVEHCKINLSRSTRTAFESRCKALSVTPFSTLLAIYQLVLSRNTNQTDFAVGIPTSGRIHEDTHNTLGFFVNSLAIPCQVKSSVEKQSFSELVNDVASFVLAAQSHQDVPFEHIVESIKVERNIHQTPIFQTFFAYDVDDLSVALKLEGIQVNRVDADITHKKFDTALSLKNTENGIDAILEYDATLYSATRMSRLLAYFSRLVSTFINDADSDIFIAPMLS